MFLPCPNWVSSKYKGFLGNLTFFSILNWLSLSTSSSLDDADDLSEGVETCSNSESVEDSTDESRETYEMLESLSDEEDEEEAFAFLRLYGMNLRTWKASVLIDCDLKDDIKPVFSVTLVLSSAKPTF